MPVDSETGKKYSSPSEALAAALPEGVDAEEVMKKLEEDGYSLASSEPSSVGVMVAVGEEEAPAEEAMAEEAPAEETEVAAAAEAAPEEEAKSEEEPMAKKRDSIAEGLMERFKTGMV
tara:strand:- start:757 stop:1110 length:354 start_codon:yes stop_codon:yes gene_type:complete